MVCSEFDCGKGMSKEFYTNYYGKGSDILVRYVDENGKRMMRKVANGQFSPVLYTEASHGVGCDARTIYGRPLTAHKFLNVWEASQKKRKWANNGTRVYGYGRFSNMYIADQYSPETISEAWDINKVSIMYLDIETECEHGFPSTKSPQERVNAITMIDSLTGHKLVLGLEGDYKTDDPNVHYKCCRNEEVLLDTFVGVFARLKPDVLTGWNLEGFDVPYLVNRIKVIFPADGEDKVNQLSPWGIVNEREVQSKFGTQRIFDIAGVAILDYMHLYKKFVLDPRDNYKLDTIVNVELGDEKLKHESGTPGHLLYREHFQDFIEYNIKDVELLVALEDKLRIIQSTMTLAYTAMVNYGDVMSQIRMWDNTIFIDLKRQGIELPVDVEEREKDIYPGAYVKPPIVGRHENVVSFDVTSEYPSLIRAMNISPEKIDSQTVFHNANASPEIADHNRAVDKYMDQEVDLERAIEKNLAVAANGHSFSRDGIGFLPAIVKRLFTERKEYKRQMLAAESAAQEATDPAEKAKHKDTAKRMDLLQNARKVQLNSLYGAMGNQYFRFYDVRMASAITLSGQMLIRWVARDVNNYVNRLSGTEGVDYIITIDTDSIYVNFGEMVKRVMPDETDKIKIADALCKFSEVKVQKVINDSFAAYAKYLNCFEPEALSMKREAVSDVGIFMAKKKYFLNIIDNEGVRYKLDERGIGKLKLMGVDAKKSSTPAMIREWMSDMFPMFMIGTEKQVQAEVLRLKELHSQMGAMDVAFNKSVSDVTGYTGSDGRPQPKVGATGRMNPAPINSRAAITYNREIKSAGIDGLYPRIHDGDKIKFAYIQMPNPFDSNVIAWADDVPTELGIEDLIDHELMFEKTFINPMKQVADAMGWEMFYRPKLDDLF